MSNKKRLTPQEVSALKASSHGVFTSTKAFNSVKSSEMAKLYFRTTKSTDFEKNWQAPAETRSENFADVHHIGDTGTKYLPYQYNRSPLLTKDVCHYRQEFVSRRSPYSENCEIAGFIKDRPSPLASKGTLPLLEKTSHQKQAFLKPPKEQAAKAVQSPFRIPNERTRTTGVVDIASESLSSSHRMHLAPTESWGRGTPCSPPMPSIGVSPKHIGVSGIDQGGWSTTYGSTFLKRQLGRTSTAPSSLRSQTKGLQQSPQQSRGADLAIEEPTIAMNRKSAFSRKPA
jgi:hypothetical protein